MGKTYIQTKVDADLKRRLTLIAQKKNLSVDELVGLFLTEGVTTYAETMRSGGGALGGSPNPMIEEQSEKN